MGTLTHDLVFNILARTPGAGPNMLLDVSLKAGCDNGQQENEVEMLKLLWHNIKEDVRRLMKMGM